MKSFIVFSLLAAAFAVPTPSGWGDWSECSATCGTATKTRSRPCITTDCVGETTEILACDLDECENVNDGRCPKLDLDPHGRACPSSKCVSDNECTRPDEKCCQVSCVKYDTNRIVTACVTAVPSPTPGPMLEEQQQGITMNPMATKNADHPRCTWGCQNVICFSDADCLPYYRCCISDWGSMVCGIPSYSLVSEPHTGKCPPISTEELTARCPDTECKADTECAATQKCCPLSCKPGARGCVDVQPSRSLQQGVFTEGLNDICKTPDKFTITYLLCTTDANCETGTFCCFGAGIPYCVKPKSKALLSDSNPMCPPNYFPNYFTEIPCSVDNICPIGMICCLDSKGIRICAYPKTKSLISECYKMGDAVDYRGSVNTTISGKACQYWTSQTPHKHARTTVKYPDKGLGDHNLCRNPDGEVSAWCYTTDPTTRYEMCDIGNPGENCGTPELNSMCPKSNKHTFFTNIPCSSDNECEEDLLCCFRESVGQVCAFSKTKNLVTELNSLCPLSSFPGYFTNIACGTDDDCPSDLLCCHGDNVGQACAFSKTKSLISECYKTENAVDYRGAANTTISGKACQSWTSQTPHKHTRRQDRYPDSGVGDHNLCRNPDKESSAWCYTTDPKTRWEVCNIGRPGQNCGLELNSMCPKSNKHMFFTNIPCSSDNECEDDLLCCFRESAGQVCAFSKTKEIKSEWHSEKYPECFRMADAVDYRGSVNTTETGKACQPWTSQTPHGHTRTSVNYPDMGLGDHNLCRNPDREPFAWCYTADPTSRWEICDIGKPGEKCGGTEVDACPAGNVKVYSMECNATEDCSKKNPNIANQICCEIMPGFSVCAVPNSRSLISGENNPTCPPGYYPSGRPCNTALDCVDTGHMPMCCNFNGQSMCVLPYAKSLISENNPTCPPGYYPSGSPCNTALDCVDTGHMPMCCNFNGQSMCVLPYAKSLISENNPTCPPGYYPSGHPCNTAQDCVDTGHMPMCCNFNGRSMCALPYAKSLISDKTLSDLRPDQIIPEAEDRIRFCVPSACEYKKCQRMVNELIYNLIPRQDWRCIQAESREHCAYLVSKRFADVAVARVDGIYTAIKKYKLKPIAYEAPVIKGSSESEALNVWESITLAITKRDNSDITRWSDLRGKKSCHAGIKEIFSFKAPVCSLIQKDIIPRNGDYVESASQYFSGSCVPGILDEKYNVQSTYPLKLCDVCAKNNGLCGISDRYAGVEGSLRCVDESKGQVTFIDNKSLEKIIADGGASKYKVVCEGESIDLENDANSWKTNKACHLAVTPRPTVMVSPHKTADYISTVMDLLTKASKNYGKKSVSSFKLFESLSYKCQISEGVYEKDVIFRDAEAQEIREFVAIGDKPFAADYIQEYSSCMTMVPQPRAKFCVVTQTAYDKCLKIKENFDKTELVNTVAWGCVLKPSKMECMRAVQEGSADLLSTDATETFIAGREFKLQPILSQYFDTLTTDIYPGITKNAFNDTTYTYTIGIMKKDRFYDLYGADTREITSLRDLNTCHAGMRKLSSFHHPIGWLLANGTVPRIGSIFESVKRYFGRSCLPGSDPAIWRMDADLLMGHEINWGFRSLNFYNFTGFDWFIWNSPATWNYYNWNKYTPATLKSLLELVDEEVGISRVEHGQHEDIDWDMLEDILNYPDGLMSPELDDPPINMFNSKRKESDKQIRRKILSYALQTRTERMEKLGEIMQLLHNIPTLQDIRTDDEDWLSHPAVQSYLQIYFPSMVGFASEIFEDAEIRKREFNRYNNPIWLSSGYADFINTMQSYQKDMCSSCIGYGDKKCQETTAEPYYDYAGALACLEEKGGDISFFEAQEFQKLLNADSSKRPEEYILVCPTGAIRLYEKDVSVVEQCNFGRVPYPAVVTGQERTGTWRWEVTKALLEAQKAFGVVQHREQQHEDQFTIFGVNSVFDVATTEVKPIDILDQIYEVYIGQNLLRSMEAIIKPSNLDWWKEDAHKCYGETYSSVIVERQGACNAVIKDLICVGAPPAKVLSVGRSGVKKAVTAEMCSRPTKHIKKPAEFTCEDGEGYTKYVDVAVNCECVPCEDVTYTLEWTKDSYWKSDAKTYQRNRGTTKETDYNLWGNRLEGRSI